MAGHVPILTQTSCFLSECAHLITLNVATKVRLYSAILGNQSVKTLLSTQEIFAFSQWEPNVASQPSTLRVSTWSTMSMFTQLSTMIQMLTLLLSLQMTLNQPSLILFLKIILRWCRKFHCPKNKKILTAKRKIWPKQKHIFCVINKILTALPLISIPMEPLSAMKQLKL